MINLEDICYHFLLKTFGGATNKGLRYLSNLVARYDPNTNITEAYVAVGRDYNTSGYAVEKAIKRYLDSWSSQATTEELATMFNYTLAPNQKSLTAKEIVILLQIYLEEHA